MDNNELNTDLLDEIESPIIHESPIPSQTRFVTYSVKFETLSIKIQS